jgi:D-alanyl-lipoteichoic acid acyltransferase DltB (MBOAT superfamily)
LQFNSIIFAVFFTVIFTGCWTIGGQRRRLQNLWLLTANCLFYGWWDARFLALIFGAALIDFALGLKLDKTEGLSSRRLLLGISLLVNLGLLGFFKYFNFFAQSATDVLHTLGMQADLPTLRLVLPLGISFYTFSRLSYSLDLYRKQIPASKDLLSFLAFSSFFPLIVAGPIERAKRLLPQFEKPRTFTVDQAKDGLRQILWGLFRKIVIADNLVAPVNAVFRDYSTMTGIDLFLGIFLYSIQIYVDFSAYSDMAMGVGKLLGFRLMRNFAYPYFSRDIAEFWRRWHISMSSWFRDYVYTPLSMKVSLAARWRRMLNIVITFTVSGLWHGANWTFVSWGLLNGLFFAPLILGKAPERDSAMVAEGKLLPSLADALRITATFLVVMLAWVFFRADSLSQAFGYLLAMTTHTWLAVPHYGTQILCCLALLALEWLRRDKVYALEKIGLPVPARWALYVTMLLAILVLGNFGSQEFVYALF